jgi:adenylate cyclase
MPTTRQLAAIMFTDIVGYTTLMGRDEQRAFDILRKNRELQKAVIEKHGGRWIKELGDGVLASFNTISDAVQAAITIQQSCNHYKDFSLRIGIHQGEVVFEENDIFGDAVNIASRIQALAPIGGIWVSETVHHNISNKQGIATKFVKEEILKNVREPVRIYEVNTELEVSVAATTIKRENKTIQEKSIAVLPFVNMSSDPEQEYFSDGLTEEIISDLSRLEKLLVISRSSMMTFKGTNKKLKEIAGEVNVRYILEGSVRKAGNALRITAQLIDALNDSHLWAEKYNGTIEDIFDIQERVSRSIVDALDLKLSTTEETQLLNHPIQNAEAFEYYMRARQEMWKLSEQGLDNAVVLTQQGLALESDNAHLYATLSTVYLFFYHYGIRFDSSYLEKAHQYAFKSLAIDANCAQAHYVYGALEFKKGKHQEASRIFKKVLSLDKNNIDALVWLAVTYFISGKPEAAKPLSEKLLQIDPLIFISCAQIPGLIEFYSGNFHEALPYYREWLRLDPEGPFTRFNCAWNFAITNNLKESIAILDTMIKETSPLIFGKFALFFKNALQGDRESALKYVTDELKLEAASIDFYPLNMAYVYALLNEKDEAVDWLNKTLPFGICPYPMFLKWEIFHQVLKDHPGFHVYMEEIRKRSEIFII